ncbi:hypothetical protein [Methylobacterium oxalidis]|uniref:Uncharacterized protein n=1 Tax=Methylobacterium oxalidis TaxID=944322 RepID=A0A512IZ60_9HYPH|nr:hypothetical protein [Methylobacterium oxalidis]GEP02965.1 hypothetical protein MOX02_10030 [Methylobacterium oxalidis]GJE30249.1 hypothetical protein LDDCCGHA_0414 [Methylobacterium oxalidis]GLS65898.1 hypothetical protein GCM10007888_42800 [Methylobacterium oxalidis]
MLPPTTAIVAFAVLFGHPFLQVCAFGLGRKAFAVSWLGRATTYGIAALAGLSAALLLGSFEASGTASDPVPTERAAPASPGPAAPVLPSDFQLPAYLVARDGRYYFKAADGSESLIQDPVNTRAIKNLIALQKDALKFRTFLARTDRPSPAWGSGKELPAGIGDWVAGPGGWVAGNDAEAGKVR